MVDQFNDVSTSAGSQDHDADAQISPDIEKAFPAPVKLMSFSESLVGGDDLPEAFNRALHAQPVEYAGGQDGDVLTAYPGLRYVAYERSIPFEHDSYLSGADLWQYYFTRPEEAQASTDQTLTQRREALARQAESQREKQELEDWRQDFRSRLSAVREKLNTYKHIIASGELKYEANRELENALRLHEDDYVVSHYYESYQDMSGAVHPAAKIIDALRLQDKDRVEAYLLRISDTTELEKLLTRLRTESEVKNKSKKDCQASWDEASALARELESQRRGFGDAIYSAVRDHGATDPLNDPDYLEAIRISNGLNAISRRGRGGIDGYGILQELNPEFLPDNAEIIVSGGYIPKIDEIIERLHDLESQMNALKAKYGISVPQSTN